MNTLQDQINKFTNSHSGRSLLSKHQLSDRGTWRILGEDPNPDMGGSHHQPDLGIVEGVLSDIIEYAVTLKGFWSWGAGGEIKPVKIKVVDTQVIKRKAELTERAVVLEAELAAVNAELKTLS